MPTESPVSAASNASPPALHSGRKARDAAAGRPAEHEAAPDGHFVQFYETEEFLVTSISQFIAAGLRAGEGALIIATENHRTRAEERLSADGFDVQRLKGTGNWRSWTRRRC
ncbi:MAG TPA: MEDS domain-containing protein [Verrucomicrobiota bacterium]|nr:MEDS domain-containing protein [Verrucomicrobiota bacterium]